MENNTFNPVDEIKAYYRLSQSETRHESGTRLAERLLEEMYRTGHIKPTHIFQAIDSLQLQKIPAIKMYRQLTNTGLAEAKAAVEQGCKIFQLFKGTPELIGHDIIAISAASALRYFKVCPNDRFERVGNDMYRPTSSVSVAVYQCPDYLMTRANS